ncbi:MAG: GNAT family N-acetyltransferase [Leucobacter sp.]
MTINIRPVREADHDGWIACYTGYHAHYAQDPTAESLATVWKWLHDEQHEVRGLVAEHDGNIIGIAHYRTFARPLASSTGIYLDDLFTATEARGHGAASALLERLQEIARDEGASVIRWITAEDNETARSLYDRLARKTAWVTYDLQPAQ